MEQENQMFENRLDLTELKESVEQIKTEIGKVIVGQEKMIDLLITAILSDGHVLLEGVPGVAKTLTAKLVAKVIDLDFSRIQFTPDLMPSDVLGTSIFNMKTSDFELKKGPIFSNIILVDEINRAPAKTQAALFEVMEERQVTLDGHTHTMEYPYLIMATQNPIEQEGTYRLPEAQLDRFLFKISVGYPSLEEETQILKDYHRRKNSHQIDQLKTVLSADQIKRFRDLISEIILEEHLFEYIAKIVHETRNHQGIYLGASPRASMAIMVSAKAHAAIKGRDFVTPEDIKGLVAPVVNHRIILTPEKEMEGLGADELIREIIDKVEVPR